ncbi:MAG: N-acetyl-gamma-glutamyl-phosphate reductase, partial [Acidobacteria bacterium]|nr:N-acetyl-gamma-glutamyl-phosphate reductase [Acidobacteriota bacterium]
MKYRVAVIGITGYSGLEMIERVLRHHAMECVAVMASETTGEKALADIHPQLRSLTDLHCVPMDAERLAELKVDTAFLCTPNEVSYELVPLILARGIRVVDLSGSFRLKDIGDYSSWYGFSHHAPELLDLAIYGLSEWNAKVISKARLIANPGCYPTSVLLALLPLVKAGLLGPGSDIFCDSKSGVTGAGRKAKLDMLFGEVGENFRPYSPISHRHAPEMCQELGWDLNNFTFVPHLLPVQRGILSTMYVSFGHPVSSAEIEKEYEKRYAQHPFVRLLGSSRLPELKAVNHTNFCDISWRLTFGGRRAVIFSAIDNLIKGAAGQAVQNFNLMHDLPETEGLLEGKAIAIRR